MNITTSTVPAVVAALVNLLDLSLPGVAVFDGPVPGATADLPERMVIVGVSGDDFICVRARQYKAPGAGVRRIEEFDINCVVETISGRSDFAEARSDAAGILATIENVIRDDPKLGGVCDWIQVGDDLNWAQVAGADGVGVGVAFTISGRAWL